MTPGNDPEFALLYTAQHVQVDKSAQSRVPGCTVSCGKQETLRDPNYSITKSSFVGHQFTDSELETGRTPNVQHSGLGYNDAVRLILGVNMMSSGSARSGDTVFYDGQTREDLASIPSPVPPLPQGMASIGRSGGTAGPSPLSAALVRAAL
jgi:hypothetical protein